ncbi:hypothetical protein HAX54_050398, partial [Datura stramonium]|nr:hypothetical protein [Datura stramonium]
GHCEEEYYVIHPEMYPKKEENVMAKGDDKAGNNESPGGFPNGNEVDKEDFQLQINKNKYEKGINK